MKFRLLFLFTYFIQLANAQLVLQPKIELGTIPSAYEIKGFTVLENKGSIKVFLLRADAEKGMRVFTSKKTLLPGDTALLSISFSPEKAGKFDKTIELVVSTDSKPLVIQLTGNLVSFQTDDRTACYYFGQRPNRKVQISDQPILVKEETKPRDSSNRLPDANSATPAPSIAVVVPSKTITPPIASNIDQLLPETIYKPNNLVFLVDISGSMRDSLKLPLMKLALHQLIDGLRPVDRITFITYADTIKILKEAGSYDDREELHHIVDRLKAKGMTKGKKAILFSQGIAQKHFIESGSNLLIIATDGKFKFEKEDQKLWQERQKLKKIVLSTIAFGEEKEALRNLKDIARKGQGSFIHIKTASESGEKLLEEIRTRSRFEQ
jgi:hypothetical protein